MGPSTHSSRCLGPTRSCGLSGTRLSPRAAHAAPAEDAGAYGPWPYLDPTVLDSSSGPSTQSSRCPRPSHPCGLSGTRLNPRADRAAPAGDAGAYSPLPYPDPPLASGPGPQPSGMPGGMWKVQHICRVPQAKQAKHAHELLTVRAAKSVSGLCRSRFQIPPMPRWGSPGCRPARIQQAREGPMVKSDGSPMEIDSTMPHVVRLPRGLSEIRPKPPCTARGGDSQPDRGTDRVGRGQGNSSHKIGRGAPGHSSPDGLWALRARASPGLRLRFLGGQPRAARAPRFMRGGKDRS